MSQIYIELNVNELVHQKKNVNELIFFITKKKKIEPIGNWFTFIYI